MARPNVLYIMTDQQRFDTIAALGNSDIYTPNLDRLVRRGLSFTKAYSTCPVCIPARYTIRTGYQPPTTRVFFNGSCDPAEGQGDTITARCGPYLARRMGQLGYRTFGIGKFHSEPVYEDLGYEVHLHGEELYESPDIRKQDAYAAWIAREHQEYDFIETLMGERTEMYYIPQMSPLPGEFGVERWAADRAIEQIGANDPRPYFGLVSFIGPHPPFAPPIPFNRMYDPDRMPNPVKGDPETDLMDEHLRWMNNTIWAEDINDSHARILKARYYGEISYIDDCLGKILDAVEARSDADNTLICFFSDHGDHMGDHHAWQKESFFESSCRVPFLLSWPKCLPPDQTKNELVSLTDLFGIATHAAGKPEPRDGIDLLDVCNGNIPPREYLVGYHGEPGCVPENLWRPAFKMMVRDAKWKYIFMSNGGREQLFDMENDPHELKNLSEIAVDVVNTLRDVAISACDVPGAKDALEGGNLKVFPHRKFPNERIYQFDSSRGVNGFPEKPEDIMKNLTSKPNKKSREK